MSVRALVAAAASSRRAEAVVVMRLQGELGNQLFQFAAGTALARRLGCPLRFDVEHHHPTVAICVGNAYQEATDAQRLQCAELRDTPLEEWVRSFQLRAWLPLRRARRRPERHLQMNDPFTPDARMAELAAPCFVRGYFQQLGLLEGVLEEVTDLVIDQLGLQAPPPGDASVVGVHFRRGDYLPRGWELPMGYYDSALKLVDRELVDPDLRVFADDEVFGQLMVEHLRAQGRRAELATDTGAGSHPAVDALADLAGCDHHVIANSTFSWWAAVLGDRLHPGVPRLVVAPERWRRELPPPDLLVPGWRAVPFEG